MIKTLFYLWLIALIILNVIPLGNETNTKLSQEKLWLFRFDYLLHSVTFLCFGWIWLLGSVLKKHQYTSMETKAAKNLKPWYFLSIIFAVAILLELVQYFLPWRSFNPMDMIANLTGAILVLIIVVVDHISVKAQDKQAHLPHPN